MRKAIVIIALALLSVTDLAAQFAKVTGVVVSKEDGEPIIGATVRVKGTKTATATDTDGRFTFANLGKDAKQVDVSYIGYESATAPISPEMKIALTVKAEMMDEVIVVAFGKQKRESFTGSASVVKADDIMKQQVNNPIEALNGRVAGMQMSETNDFSSDPSITIRGIGSLNASTEPLIVVDGLPYNGYLNDLNPADIANITVLKDAASNALYGARGANGVVLITTKNAERGTTKVTLDAKWGVNTNAKVDYDKIDNPGEYYEMHYRYLRNYFQYAIGQTPGQAHLSANSTMGKDASSGGLGYMVYTVPLGQTLIGTNGKLNPAATLGNRVSYNGQVYTLYPDDWREEGLRDGFRQEYNLNMTGGTDRFAFIASLGYLGNDGICRGTDLRRTSARLKAEYQAYDFLRIGANAGYNHSVTNTSGEAFGAAYGVAPIYPLYIRDGEGNIMEGEHGRLYDYGAGTSQAPGLNRPVEINNNPVQNDLLNVSNNVANSFNMQGWMNIDFLKDFRLTVNGSVYITENRIKYGTNPYFGYSSLSSHGAVSVYHYRTTDTNFQQLLNYHKEIGRNTIDALAGHEYSHNSQTSLGGTKTNVADYEHNTELSGAIVNGAPFGSMSNYNVEGWFTRAQYDYDSRYFLSGSFRRDGSTTFHPKHRWGNFWSVGGAWIATREEWWPKSTWLNMLKLKLSYGEQGNDGIGSFRYTDFYNLVNVNDQPAYQFYSKGNEDITWETVGCLNAGVEFELWNSRLRGGVEYYNRKTSDMLMWVATPYTLGYSGYYDNIGDMRNQGIEVELSADIFNTRDFGWNFNLNLTWQRNRVTRLADDNKKKVVEGYPGYQNGYMYIAEGLPVNSWYVKRYAGVSATGEAQYYKKGADGELVATDYSNGDYFLYGNALANVFGGFSTAFRFKGFDLSANFNYSIGGKRYDSAYSGLMSSPISSVTGGQFHRDLYKAWTPDNTSSDIPRLQYGDQYSASHSDRFLTDASYLTFKNLTFGYSLPKSLLSKMHVTQLRVYFNCDNVYYWTSRKGFDPRGGAAGSYGSSGSDALPMRTFSGGINVQF